jgi:antitoxin ParD1/3/4
MAASIMAIVNLPLPDPMQDWVEKRLRAGEYASFSDYVIDLVRLDRERHESLIEALIEGENSGLSSRSVSDIIGDTKAKIVNGEI